MNATFAGKPFARTTRLEPTLKGLLSSFAGGSNFQVA